MEKIRIGVLVSGGGTNLQSVIDSADKGVFNGSVVVVISSNPKAYALERAAKAGIEGVYIGKENYPESKARNQALVEALKERNVDLVVLAGYMSILEPEFIEAFRNRIINIHPSLIPNFCGKGFYGKRVHQAVIDGAAKKTGATVHFVDEGTDTGPIIIQREIDVFENDTADSLAARVLEVEHMILPEAIRLFCEGDLK